MYLVISKCIVVHDLVNCNNTSSQFKFTNSNMTKLYYTPTSCGASSFIAAFTAGVSIETEEVDLARHLTASGVDFYTINPKAIGSENTLLPSG